MHINVIVLLNNVSNVLCQHPQNSCKIKKCQFNNKKINYEIKKDSSDKYKVWLYPSVLKFVCRMDYII